MTSADEKIGELEDELRRVKQKLALEESKNDAPTNRAIHLIRRLLEALEAYPDGEAAIREAMRPRGDILLPDRAREVWRKYDLDTYLW